ncbi:MAG: cation transporter, partial [Candidatus Aminicenantes bacterium]|nr:cation transporter [Candidatus Aminicenantes bacterium]
MTLRLSQAINKIKEHGYEVEPNQIELIIEGISCAACVARIETELRKREGLIDISINLATKKAKVTFIEDLIKPKEIQEIINRLGYKATFLQNKEKSIYLSEIIAKNEYQQLRYHFLGAIILAIVIFMASMPHWFPFVPSWLQSPFVIWFLATPVQFYFGWPFLTSAGKALRHGQANMNTLVSIGTLAAYIYSVLATLFPSFFHKASLKPQLYFDTSAFIIALILFGRMLESQARSQTSKAIQ